MSPMGFKWQLCVGGNVVYHLGFPDSPRDLKDGSAFTKADVIANLQQLKLNADLFLTHNSLGEYGHLHH